MSENWEAIVDYEGSYEVSNHGRVRSLTRNVCNGDLWRGKIMALHKRRDGYLSVGLRDAAGKKNTKKIHRLVLESFFGIAKDGQQCLHRDGCRSNNMLSNLLWGTARDNSLDTIRHGRSGKGEQHPGANFCDLDIWLIRSISGRGKGVKLAGFFEVSASAISKIKRYQRWNHVFGALDLRSGGDESKSLR